MKKTMGGVQKPVKGNTGITSGGASMSNPKGVQGQSGFGYAPECKTAMATGGGKKK